MISSLGRLDSRNAARHTLLKRPSAQSKAPDDTSVTNERQTFVEEEDENDGGDEDNGGGEGGSFPFLNTNMIIYVVLGLVLFKAFKK